MTCWMSPPSAAVVITVAANPLAAVTGVAFTPSYATFIPSSAWETAASPVSAKSTRCALIFSSTSSQMSMKIL